MPAGHGRKIGAWGLPEGSRAGGQAPACAPVHVGLPVLCQPPAAPGRGPVLTSRPAHELQQDVRSGAMALTCVHAHCVGMLCGHSDAHTRGHEHHAALCQQTAGRCYLPVAGCLSTLGQIVTTSQTSRALIAKVTNTNYDCCCASGSCSEHRTVVDVAYHSHGLRICRRAWQTQTSITWCCSTWHGESAV